ncbi:transposase [Clostridium acetobutylicum]|uniref:transposase n=1 Tax=Clostridium sp. NJ4 TaxID=2126737 RepID=UPI0030B8951E
MNLTKWAELNAYKSASSRLKKEFQIIKKQLWEEHFWSISYWLITTRSEQIDIVKK